LPVDEDTIGVIESAYRSAILQSMSHPQKAADRELCRFVEDMLHILQVVFSASAQNPDSFGALSISRSKLLWIIAELVWNATPRAGRKHRGASYRRSLVLWSTLFQLMSESEGRELQRCIPYWPAPLRRRFFSALEYRRRNRWPHNPFSSRMLGLRFKCHTLEAVLDLSATPSSQPSKSRI
jgi:hypothetical protein